MALQSHHRFGVQSLVPFDPAYPGGGGCLAWLAGGAANRRKGDGDNEMSCGGLLATFFFVCVYMVLFLHVESIHFVVIIIIMIIIIIIIIILATDSSFFTSFHSFFLFLADLKTALLSVSIEGLLAGHLRIT